MVFGVFAYVKGGERCLFTNDGIWMSVTSQMSAADLEETGKTFKGFQQAKFWITEHKEHDRGNFIKVLLPTGEFVKKETLRIRIELIKRIDKPYIPSKEYLIKLFEHAMSERELYWTIHFSGKVKLHLHNNLSIRDIKEGFAIHPLKVPVELIKTNGYEPKEFVERMYARVLQTWLLHLMTNQTELLVNQATYTVQELLKKIYRLYDAIEFEEELLYKELVGRYKIEMMERSLKNNCYIS